MYNQFKKSSRKKNLFSLAILFLSIFFLLFVEACKKKTSVTTEKPAEQKKQELATPTKKVVLHSALAGRWYPADAETLGRQIEGFFQKADVEKINNVIALILPHAGYQFSGQTAAFALKSTAGRRPAEDKKYKRVVIIGLNHPGYMEEALSVPRVTHYETPLGQIPLDTEFINRLLEYSLFQNIPQAHKYEHSVQIEIPLLQHCQKSALGRLTADFKLVPIVAGRCSLKTIRKAGAILRSLVDDETLVIASSDFVHYGRNYGYVPFTENIPEQIKKLDMDAYEYIARLDSSGFLEYRRKTGATICGYVPIAILLSMLPQPAKSHLIKYTTSGELMGDYSNTVSYLSVAFSGTWGNHPQINPQSLGLQSEHNTAGLTEQDKKQLLILASKSILYALKHRQIPEASDLDVTISDAMKQPRAAFVTLKKNGQLRGCIGDIFPQRPLYKSVITNAINAAVNDRRFPRVAIAECNDITIEISALTVPEPITSPDEIRIGVDGVVLRKNGRSAVFLPQVAPEQGWDVNTMLTRLSLKADLPGDAWKEGASFMTFQAVIFSEKEE